METTQPHKGVKIIAPILLHSHIPKIAIFFSRPNTASGYSTTTIVNI